MKKIKLFEDFSQDEEYGKILLNYGNDLPTTWYYIEDAIINGLLDEKLQLDEDIIETFCEEQSYEEMCGQQDLCDMLIQDFDNVLNRLLNYLKENDMLDEIPSSVIINGTDEKGEEWALEWHKEV